MNRKIYGITVGSPLPKSNLKQEDPSKGDYVKGKEIIPTKVSELENDSQYLKEADLHAAIEESLALAKESGQFKGEAGEAGYTPVAGTDYFTNADREAMVDDVLDMIPQATSISFVKAGNIITASITLDDGTTSTSDITLNGDGYPTMVATDGVYCGVTWRGFDE